MDRRKQIEEERKKIEHIDKRAMHRYKIYKALYWVNVFHWSSSSILDYITQGCKRGFTAKLKQKGFLVEKEIFPDSPWFPRKILTLSKKGKEELMAMNTLIDPEYIWTGKIANGRIWHDYLIQFYVAKYVAERQLQNIDKIIINDTKHFYKVYDAVIYLNLNDEIKILGIEIERTRKKLFEAANMLYNIAKDIKENRVDEVHIVYTQETIKNYFNKLIQAFTTKEKNCIFYLYKRPYKNSGRYEQTAKSVTISLQDLNIKFVELKENSKLCPKPKPKKEYIEEKDILDDIEDIVDYIDSDNEVVEDI